MPRPRKNNPELPPYVRIRSGSYLYRNAKLCAVADGHQAMLGLLEAAKIARAAGVPRPAKRRRSYEIILIETLRARLHSAKSRVGGSACQITLDDLIDLAKQNGWRCALTGLPFELDRAGVGNAMPFGPSIDRKESSKGYTKDNVRVVCLAVNYALNEWGDDVFRKISIAFATKSGFQPGQNP